MIYLKNHNEIIKNELRHFLAQQVKNEQLEEDFMMNSEFPLFIVEEIARSIDTIFKKALIDFLLKYGEKHDLDFIQLKAMIGK